MTPIKEPFNAPKGNSPQVENLWLRVGFFQLFCCVCGGELFACFSEEKFHIAGIDLKSAVSMRLVPHPDPLVPTFQSAGFTSMYHHIQLCAHLKIVS